MVHAQQLEPAQATIKHEKSSRACWVVRVDPEPKTLKKAWKDYLERNYNFRIDGIGFLANKDLLSAEQVKLPVLSATPVYFYTHIVENSTGSEMKVFAADQHKNYYSDRHQPDKFMELRDILENFLKVYLPQYHQEIINDTQQEVAQLTKETTKLEEEIAENAEKIEALTSEIEDMKVETEDTKAKLDKAKLKLEKRKARLERRRTQLLD
ncbi:MAG: hypothetical protein DHS20C17_15940 [Cyclobacteriaceae bacterium]|nr:MAG: hypothetical protein DHS20C17_15940 [Cyclobacteriaceae bacterium]